MKQNAKDANSIFCLALLGEIEKWRNNGARPIVLVLKMILAKF